VLLATAGNAQNRSDDMTLEPGRAVERQLTRGEEHRYQIALTAGECANVVVEQLGIDIVATSAVAPDSAVAMPCARQSWRC
jgi:hypothetical protein